MSSELDIHDLREGQEGHHSEFVALKEPAWLVRILHSSETEYCFKTDELALTEGDHVVVETRYGKDMAKVLGVTKCAHITHPNGNGEHGVEFHTLLRKASEEDLHRYQDQERRAKDAYSVCREKIREHRLEMKLVKAHFLFDDPKILFFFTADERVDFRELVKDLVSVFRMRIELRQIGVRDEARVTGGCGVCGRVFCCHGMSDKLKPVSIKMAKVQNLSLNSMKISGPCGRLLCCLSYEYDTYCDEKRDLPPEGYKFEYDGAWFRVTEINILSAKLRLFSDDSRMLELPFSRISYSKEDRRWIIRDI